MAFHRLLRWSACLPLVLAQGSSLELPSLSSVSESLTSAVTASESLTTSVSVSSLLAISSSFADWSITIPLTSVSSSTAEFLPSTISVSENTTTTQSVPTTTGGLATTTRNTVPISSYTFSPFPSPSATGGVPTEPLSPPKVDSGILPDFSAAWASAYEKAKGLVSTFTLEDKVAVTTGDGWEAGLCVGTTPPINGSVFPGLCLEDSPLGVRFADYVTAFPAGISTAATFNRRLMRRRGLYMGREHVGKGVHVALGPMMNMGRLAEGGRNFEGFGGDPFLAGEASYETILGMQEAGVQACAKHLVGNEQEWHRTTSSSDIDDRTQHEIYIHPYLKSVMAGVASIMCSYNMLNGTYACESDKVLNDIVKRELGFQGYLMSDWGATMSTISAITGLDMTMPGDVAFHSNDSYFGGNLTAYVQNSIIPEARVDDMAIRIVAAWYFLGQDDPAFPKTNFDGFRPDNDETNQHIDVQEDHYKLVREVGAASTVLLKNTGGVLPLNKPRSLLVAGSDAGPGTIGPNQFSDQGGSDGVLAMGWGSGTAWFTYLLSPLESIQAKAREDHTALTWILDDFNLERAGSLAAKKSAALVFINSDAGEEYITVDDNMGDRKNLTAWHGGDDLVLAVAAKNNNTIVVFHSVGPAILEPWVDHPNVTAILWAGLPGTEAGNAIVDVLYGAWNPSGRLPYTIAKEPDDYPATLQKVGQPSDLLVIPYTEGLNIDYRHFDTYNITPRYEFGFGLSYTTFEYSDLSIWREEGSEAAQAWEAGKATEIFVGSSTAAWLHEPIFTVGFTVTNTGAYYGGEIPQVYLNLPASSGEPPSILKGFTNVEIEPGESAWVEITLSRYDVSIWDTDAQGWRRPEGVIGVTVGASSRDGRLKGELP